MKKRIMIVALVVLAGFWGMEGALLSPVSAASPAYKMDLQCWPQGGPYFEQIKFFGQRVERYSNGRIKVNILPGGTVAPMTKEFDALETGALKWAVTSHNMFLGRLGRVGGLFGADPVGPNAAELFAWWRFGDAHKLWAEMFKRAKADILMIGGPMHLTGAESFGWFKKPITSLSDFKGMKYRCMGLYGEVAKKMGAAVVNLPGGEIYQAFERGVIDGFEYCTPAMDLAAGFHNLKAVRMEPGMQSTTSMSSLLVRRDTWEKVPDEFKVLIEAAAWGGMEDYAWSTIEDAKAIKKFDEMGVKTHFLPQEVQREIVKQVEMLYEELGKADPFFKQVLDNRNKFLKDFRSVDYVVQPRYEWKYSFSK
jgi:TRAP-type mannitol/chloroaromatic compound transport system substrate-binding protein